MAKYRSGLRSHYKVEMQSGEVLDLQTELSDVMRWESQHDGKAWLTWPMPLGRQLWVAWRAGRRLGFVDEKTPDVWMDQVLEFEDLTDADTADAAEDDEDGAGERGPTPPGPSA